jgi:crotonobetainyl-CoA:carnitine CoA-transferase CaiB-like acyl-CoA transferase
MRVLDLSQQLPGPYCTLLLAGLGATVTKVEPTYGDAAREIDPEMFARVNRGKTSVRLDLKTEKDRAHLRALAAQSDVVVEGFRPGVTARLGCDVATLSEVNPALVYCSISGFGQDGPLATQPAHDLSLQAIAGAVRPSASADTVGVPWVDLGVATTAAFLIASHWPTDRGVHLDLAMLDVASAWATVKPTAVTRVEPTYGTFTSADGVVFALALLEDGMWRRLCDALDLTGWSAAHRLETYAGRVAAGERVRERIAHEVGRRAAHELAALATRHELPLDRALKPDQGVHHPQVAWRRQESRQGGVVPLGPQVGVPLSPLVESDRFNHTFGGTEGE